MRITNLACALTAIIAVQVMAADVTEVQLESGRLKGAANGNVVAFKGIPFAAPPTGANRWRPPQPVAPWSEVRQATDYGPDCMQLPFPSDAAPLGSKPSEDCLYMNVWTPAKRSSALPVMVWFYGGGFVNGGSSPAVYDGSHFAERGLVLVSFNYRVGRFGFFAHPALSKEDPSAPLANYAFMDQIAALKWVRRNVEQFGGDPNNVTIFGESAGGMSVLTMLTSPMSRGLFQKAIIESGGGRSLIGPPRYVSESKPNAPSGEQVGLLFAKNAGITGTDEAALAALRALPADRIVDGLNMASMNTPTYAGPMIDGKVVIETPEQAFLAGHEMKVPLIDGANSSDIGFSMAKTMDEVFAPFGANKSEAEQAYNPGHSSDVRGIGTSVAADAMMIEPARFVIREMTDAGQHSYEYRFSYVAGSMRNQWHGAPHATEIPFVFDTVTAKYGKDLTHDDAAIAAQMNEYWVAFAKTGDPNAGGLPKWPAYNAKRDLLLNFTEHGPVAEPDPWKQRLDFTESLAAGGK